MSTYSIDKNLFPVFFAPSREEFLKKLVFYLISRDVYDFTLWEVTGNVCRPSSVSNASLTVAADLFELGYASGCIEKVNRRVRQFDEEFYISSSVFFKSSERVILAITFHSDADENVLLELERFAEHLSSRYREVVAKDRHMDLYVDYQKKVDFIKKASVMFKALEIEQVISVSLTFFSETFSADAVCALRGDKFVGLGIEELNAERDIYVEDASLLEFMKGTEETVFVEDKIFSPRFNVKNIFFVTEPVEGLRFALFNVLTENVPDKDFSSLVSAIVSIAVENARSHEEMTLFKIEETEMNRTAAILNKFVRNDLAFERFYKYGGLKENADGTSYDIFAMTRPAKKAGGDFVEIKIEGEKIRFCVADVCGKGYAAAVFTVALSVFFSESDFSDPAAFLSDLNDFMLEKDFENQFITGFFGVVDLNSRILDYVSCGHEPAAIIKGAETRYLESRNLPLGIEREIYETTSCKLPEGSVLFVYTDGLAEYESYERLTEMVRKTSGKRAREIACGLYNSLVTDHNAQKDDFTCAIMKF